MTQTPLPARSSNMGKWDNVYRNMFLVNDRGPAFYADAVTYLMAAAFLADVEEVEDWGCGGVAASGASA